MLVALLALTLAFQAGASGVSPSVAGLWKTAGDEGLVRIDACGAEICGRIASPAPAGDPAPEGLLILKLKPIGQDRWGDGWIYNPDNGKRYHASIALTHDGNLRLKGCLVVPLCQSQTWTRAVRVAGRGGAAMATR
ncbi:MAG TPA: DUF2147 domain-containing protein [Caulobacteraceae bacterium]|jgi:uncharacterized protein (DUF2147 family)